MIFFLELHPNQPNSVYIRLLHLTRRDTGTEEMAIFEKESRQKPTKTSFPPKYHVYTAFQKKHQTLAHPKINRTYRSIDKMSQKKKKKMQLAYTCRQIGKCIWMYWVSDKALV